MMISSELSRRNWPFPVAAVEGQTPEQLMMLHQNLIWETLAESLGLNPPRKVR